MARAVSYSGKFCEGLIGHFEAGQRWFENQDGEKSGAEFPTFQGYATSIGVSMDTLLQWRREHKRFDSAFLRAKTIQKELWLRYSMGKEANAALLKEIGAQLGIYDQDKPESGETQQQKIVIELRVV